MLTAWLGLSGWLVARLRLLPLLWAAAFGTMPVGPAHGGFLVTTNQFLLPSGTRVEFAGSPTDLAVSPDGATVAVAVSNTVLLYSSAGRLLQTVTLPGGAEYGGLVFSADGQSLAVSNGIGVSMIAIPAGNVISTISIPDSIPCGLAFDPVRPYLYVALNYNNQVARVDLLQMRVTAVAPVGVAPVGVAVTPDGSRLFVTNWGGRNPVAGDLTALSAGSPVVVDGRGVAASGTVTALSLDPFQVLGNIDVGLHPAAIRVSPDGALVAVANANSDSLSFINPATLAVTGVIGLAASPPGYVGSSPTSLAFNADGSRLYVTCAGNNSVMTLVRHGGSYQVGVSTPTDWYPVAVAVRSQDPAEYGAGRQRQRCGFQGGRPPIRRSSEAGDVGSFPGGRGSGPDWRIPLE